MLVRELYFQTGLKGSPLLLINNRLQNTRTIYDWQKTLIGPAAHGRGLEQGAINSSDFHKVYNNEQIKSANKSNLGADLGSSIVSAIGQADDVALLSNSIFSLQLLLKLTEQYWDKYDVALVPEKFKLLAYIPKGQELAA